MLRGHHLPFQSTPGLLQAPMLPGRGSHSLDDGHWGQRPVTTVDKVVGSACLPQCAAHGMGLWEGSPS